MKFAILSRFVAVCERHGIPEIHSKVVFQHLVAKYSEPHRAYHNLDHIERMLRLFTEYGIPDDEVELAIWFHDVIYDPNGKHNERKSADYFLAHLGGYLWDDFSREVERLIVATNPMMKRRGSNRENLIIDIDLSILGASPAEYLDYTEGVRKEYSSVPDSKFCEGRDKILRSILSEKIFVTQHFSDLEPQARENIQEELKKLGTKLC